MRFTPFLILGLALGLGACASTDTRYPSLATRDVERVEGQFEPVAAEPLDVPEVPVRLPDGQTPRLEALLAEARAAHEEFTSTAPGAASRVDAARGASNQSDAWAAAQVALADLDSTRSRTAIALGDLDILYIAASVQAEERGAIDAAREQVIAFVREQDAILERLRAASR